MTGQGHECLATPALPGPPAERAAPSPGAGRGEWGRASRPKAEGLLPVCGLLTRGKWIIDKTSHQVSTQASLLAARPCLPEAGLLSGGPKERADHLKAKRGVLKAPPRCFMPDSHYLIILLSH